MATFKTIVEGQKKTISAQAKQIEDLQLAVLENAARSQFSLVMLVHIIATVRDICVSRGGNAKEIWIKFGTGLQDQKRSNKFYQFTFPSFKKSTHAVDTFRNITDIFQNLIAILIRARTSRGPTDARS